MEWKRNNNNCMKIKQAFTLCLLSLCSNNVFSQTTPNFKPFTRNLEFAKANESSVKDLLDTTSKKFLLIANDTASEIHKSIQSEFKMAQETDHLQSYIYPQKLKRNSFILQFVDWSQENGILGEDSVWRSETLDAMIFIPVMYEDRHGESVINICFTTQLVIYVESKTDGKENPKTTFGIKKMDFDEILAKGFLNK